MPESHLKVISDEANQDSIGFGKNMNSRVAKLLELKAKFERLWLTDPERFNPLRNCQQRERLKRTWDLLQNHSTIREKSTVDIGCAAGVFSRMLRDAGAHVEAVDIAENALKHFKDAGADGIQLKNDTMPFTTLPDQAYNIVICTELIAELPRDDYRLFFSELARLIKQDGLLICSSDIDIHTMDGVERLIELAQTEFDVIGEVPSYHSLYIRIKEFFDVPFNFIEGWKNREYRKQELAKRKGLNYFWFWINTTPLLAWLWYACEPASRPIRKLIRQNNSLLLFLEKICRFLWDRDGISHFIFIAKRRALKKPSPDEMPIEKPRRKEIWE